jgi:hypothetical protein
MSSPVTSPDETHQARAVAVVKSSAPIHRRWWLAVIGILLYLVLAPDGTHHWHEWRYLYSAAHFSVAELAEGRFDAGPPPARSADETGAWYWGQMLHEATLSAVVSRLGPGLPTVNALQWLYGLFPLLAALFIFLGVRRLPLRLDPLAVSLVFLLSPISTYLGFKLMAEGPALLFGALAIWLLNGSLYSPSRVRSVLQAALAGVFGALSLLFMVYVPLLLLGYVAALFLVCKPSVLVVWLLVMLAAALPIAGGLFLHWGVSPGDLVLMYGFFRQYVKPLPVSFFNVLLAGSLLWAILPLAWRSPRREEVRFLSLWAAVSVVPILVLSSNYVEMRFLSVGLVPLAGLVFLAVGKAVPWSRAASVALIALPALASLISAPFTPYEMSSRELAAAVQRIRSTHPQGAILVPWNYTDYHFLALAFPDAPVYLVQSPVDTRGRVVRDEWWERKQRLIYGSAYIGNESPDWRDGSSWNRS